MPAYGVSVLGSPAAAAAAAYATFHTVASRRASIFKLIVTNASTVFSQLGLVLASNTPVATTSITPQAYDAADATATALLDTAWSTAPTVSAGTYFYQASFGPSQGSGDAENWPADKMITLAKSVWLVFWNPGAAAGGALSITLGYSE